MAESNTRIGGSGWTTFTWRGQRLAWMQIIQDTAPAPVAAPQAVQPLDAEHPVEIVTPRAVGAGTLRLTVYELWNAPVWQQLAGLEKASQLLDVFKHQVRLGNVSCRKIIKSPPPHRFRIKNYYGCTVTEVDDSETVQISSMVMPKSITVQYTHFGLV